MRMKRLIPRLCLLLAAVAGLACVLLAREETPVLEPSRPSGFYEEPFYLELRAPAGEIYYTLDGSVPDRTSTRYTGPIYIDDASENENVLSARTDLDSFEDQYPDIILTVIPKQKVDKATILRAVHYDTTGLKSGELCLSYFVGFQNKTGYGDLNIVSVVTDPDNLTDYENGIFVRGETYDNNIENWGSIRAPGNYSNKGSQWEREAHFSYFDGSGEQLFQSGCGIRIMGGWHRLSVLKSLNLYAREEYGGSETFDYDFFDTGLRPHKLTLHSGSNDYYGKIQNLLVSGLTRELDMGTLHYNVCVLFLNGEYWGIYNLTEKYDGEYLAQTYGVDKNDVLSVKYESLEIGDERNMHLFTDAVEFLVQADLTREENYRHFQELFDEQSLLDLFATEIYCARNEDWPNGNIHMWRTVSTGGKDYADGRWRYLMYDLDSAGLTENLITHDTVQTAMDACPYFASLCRNETFRKKLGANILRIGEKYLSAEKVNRCIDAYETRMAEPMKPYFLRFFDSTPEKFYERLESNRAFFDNRLDAIIPILEQHHMLP